MLTAARAEVRELAERLTREYVGLVAPGRILALVYRTERALSRVGHLPPGERVAMCETIVRRLVVEQAELAA